MKSAPDKYWDVDTPALLIELDQLERNLAGMARLARQWNVSLRPHIKTHKSLALAKLQLSHSADGLSTAKLDEAEVMAEVSDDLFVAYPIVSRAKAERVARLAATTKRFVVGLDHEAGIEQLGAIAREADRPLKVLIEVDSGLGRCGVPPDGVGELARLANRSGWLEVAGVFTHAGHAYRATGADEVRATAGDEVRAALEAAESLPSSSEPYVVSVGSTPTSLVDVDRTGITEVRPGNYIFMDRTQVSLGVAALDQCALTVLATVVSAQPGRAVIDAGSKVFGLDRGGHGVASIDGYGVDVLSGAVVSWLSEEHGVIDDPERRLEVGDRVRVVPNHACTATNLASRLWGVRDGVVETEFTVDVRGGGC